MFCISSEMNCIFVTKTKYKCRIPEAVCVSVVLCIAGTAEVKKPLFAPRHSRAFLYNDLILTELFGYFYHIEVSRMNA